MSNPDYEKFAPLLLGMKRAVVKGYKAPHKPILLMSICELVASGDIADNRIVLSNALVLKFKQLWKRHIDTEDEPRHDSVAEALFGNEQKVYPFKCNIANPFYHLSGEPFWHLKKSERWQPRNSWTVASLKSDFNYALLDPTLFQLMQHTPSREKLHALLLSMI